MDERLGRLAWAAAAIALFIGIAVSVLRGGLFSYYRAVLMVTPFLLIAFLRLRSWWHVILLIAMIAGRIRLRMAGLEHVTPMLVVSSFLVGIAVLDSVLSRGDDNAPKRFWEEKIVFVVALLMTLRFVIERPGFVRLGADEGGFFTAVFYVVGSWVFFATSRVVARARLTRRQLVASGIITFILFLYALWRGHFYTRHPMTRVLGEQETWLLSAILLSLLGTVPRSLATMWKYQLSAVAFMIMPAVSTYRARVFYVLGGVGAVSWLTRMRKPMALALLVSVAAAVVLTTVAPRHMPLGMDRFASLFVDVGHEQRSVGAYGWTDSFRENLFRMAWMQIRLRPITGRGYSLNVQEALAILSVHRGGITQTEMVALGGHYHNSVVALAVVAGMPIAAMFALVVVVVPIRFIRFVLKLPRGDLFTWAVMISGFYCATLGMMMLNGGPREFVYCMILTGYMVGLMRNRGEAKDEGERAQGAEGPRDGFLRNGAPGLRSAVTG